jgi:endogenous inhibitor of DNA gyrase (YacG/DUF329 family)
MDNDVFCLKCGNQVELIFDETERFKNFACRCKVVKMDSWVGGTASIVNLAQGLNFMFVSDNKTVQSSSGNCIFYEFEDKNVDVDV